MALGTAAPGTHLNQRKSEKLGSVSSALICVQRGCRVSYRPLSSRLGTEEIVDNSDFENMFWRVTENVPSWSRKPY